MFIKKINYRQYYYDYLISWNDNELFESSKLSCGKRIEYNKITSVKNLKLVDKFESSIVPNLNIKEKISFAIYGITKFLLLLPQIISINIHFFYHSEIVVINRKRTDYRTYQILRLVITDKFQDTYICEFPIDVNQLSFNEIVNQICIKLLIQYAEIKLKSKFIGINKYNNIPIIYSPQATGFFIHEVIGHLLEEDVYNLYGKSILEKIKIDKKLKVIDDATDCSYIIGLNKIDDCGNPVKPAVLIENGKVQNILSSSIGALRRENFNKIAVPRMRNTFVYPYSNLNLEQIKSKYYKCIVITQVFMGSCEFQNGNYWLIGHGQLIEEQKIVATISNIKISFSIKEHLENITYIGNDFNVFSSDCSKLENIVKVCMGGPSISFPNVTVEGQEYV